MTGRTAGGWWLVLAAVLVAGCYNPQLGSPGHYCHEADNPACPTGQACVAGRCITGGMSLPGDLGRVDLSSVPPDSGAPPADFSAPPADFSAPPADLSAPPADMACLPSGTACTGTDKCCTICFFSSCF